MHLRTPSVKHVVIPSLAVNHEALLLVHRGLATLQIHRTMKPLHWISIFLLEVSIVKEAWTLTTVSSLMRIVNPSQDRPNLSCADAVLMKSTYKEQAPLKVDCDDAGLCLEYLPCEIS